MSLGILLVFYIILVILAGIIQYLLYKSKHKNNNKIFFINMIFAIFLSYVSFTALPSNFSGQKFIAIAWSLIAIFAVIIKLITGKYSMLSKIMLSLSISGGFLQLYFY
ncbi:MAG TPA: hypothetical protein VK121_07220 [Pseudogracilibacillus sp.]|nr:hypothetical protein [Pseudogracilibacillus sp.]